jgi:hypothetical protein
MLTTNAIITAKVLFLILVLLLIENLVSLLLAHRLPPNAPVQQWQNAVCCKRLLN